MAPMSVVNVGSIPNPRPITGVRPMGRGLAGYHHSASASGKEFPPFRLDKVNQCLWRRADNGEDAYLALKPKSFAVLRYLVDHAGRLVTQDELLDAVWPDTHVQPDVLKRHIFDVRDVLGDDSKHPSYIETIARRGYRFSAAVRNAASAEPSPAEIPPRTKIVGRDPVLGELQSHFANAIAGQRQIVFVTGAPGSGKTTLVDEFQRQVADSPVRIARGQCVEGYGSKEAYYPVLEALGKLCRGPEGDSVVQTLAAEAPTWLVQFPGLINRQQRETLQRETQGAARQRMLREISGALETITSEIPLMLVLEDLHWVDRSTVDLISALARGRGTAKLLVIATCRLPAVALSDYPLKRVKKDLLVHRLCQEITLKPLREVEIAAYLAAESPGTRVPEGPAAMLQQHLEGNPLCTEAALEHLTGRDFVAREGGSWQFRPPTEEKGLEVPEFEELHSSAQEREPGGRGTSLCGACGNDEKPRREMDATPAEKSKSGALERPALARAEHLVADLTVTELPPGSQLGPYRILSLLGVGGMGEVYKARDTRLGRIVAIKRLKQQHSARFKQEARTIAGLNHPHICQIYDVGLDYLVLEYIEGQPLHGPVPAEEARRLAQEIASALQEAHCRSIVHRDLKPANILIDIKGSAKLLDFGLARLRGSGSSDETLTIEDAVVGTAAYMSPEQAQGKPLDQRSDIFSFGAVLYELLSGQKAFTGNSTLDILNAVVHAEPAKLKAPAPFTAIVTRCLRKAPAERFRSMTEILAALNQASAEPVAQQPSIAVLPWANLSSSKDDEYFSDGLTEELLNVLAQVAELKVIARTWAFAFKGKNEDIRTIADTLGVTNVLAGSVRRVGTRLRVTAQLIRATDGTHIWSQRYDRELTDVFAVQDDIAAAIARALQVQLTSKSIAGRPHEPYLAA
jgi:serine/threonine protein kinase/DNA-binding winged helix-turn-helix (wHTH) protein